MVDTKFGINYQVFRLSVSFGYTFQRVNKLLVMYLLLQDINVYIYFLSTSNSTGDNNNIYIIYNNIINYYISINTYC